MAIPPISSAAISAATSCCSIPSSAACRRYSPCGPTAAPARCSMRRSNTPWRMARALVATRPWRMSPRCCSPKHCGSTPPRSATRPAGSPPLPIPWWSRALKAMHDEPTRDWSADELARAWRQQLALGAGRALQGAASASRRSAIWSRWRMQIAAELLRTTALKLADVAERLRLRLGSRLQPRLPPPSGPVPGAMARWRAVGPVGSGEQEQLRARGPTLIRPSATFSHQGRRHGAATSRPSPSPLVGKISKGG